MVEAGAGPAGPGLGGVVDRQRRSHDRPGGRVAVHREVGRPVKGEERDVGAHHRVDLVLGQPQLTLATGGLDQPHEGLPLRVVAEVHGRRGVGQALEQGGERQQLAAHRLQRAALLVLVLQRPPEPEERDGGGVGVDLEGTSRSGRKRVHVELEPFGQGAPAWHARELELAPVRGMGTGVEAREVTVEGGLRGAVARVVGDDERGVDRHHARAPEVGRQGGVDVLVGALGRDVDQRAALVEDGQPRRAAASPGQVHSHGVHAPTLPHGPHHCELVGVASVSSRARTRANGPRPAGGEPWSSTERACWWPERAVPWAGSSPTRCGSGGPPWWPAVATAIGCVRSPSAAAPSR